MYEVQEFDNGLKEAHEDYDNMLNFSSEVEYDERFDMDKYRTDMKPDRLLDRGLPQDRRLNPLVQQKENKKELFTAYR